MALDLFDLVTPDVLTGYARQALQDRAENQRLLSAWLPGQAVNDLLYRFSRGSGAGLAEAAMFRAYDAEPRFGRREGISRVTGELPPIGQQYILGEYDSLRLRNADTEIRDLLLRDAARIALAIDTRFEFARADALVNGSVTLNEDGVQATVSFGRSGTHAVAPATLWSNLASSTPIDDLQTWRDVYVATNGSEPGAILTSTRIAGYLARNAQVRSMILPVGSTVTQVRRSDVDTVLADFSLPPIEIWDARAVDQAGTTRRFIADDIVLMLPARGESQLGATLWGTTLEAQEPQYGLGPGDHPGLVVGAFKQSTTPIRVFTIGAAIGLPILANPDLTLKADVA
jgi:hypothetical protein